MSLVLDATERRVLGSLLEKQRTVPDAYPLTLNALRSACNQTSGRDPVLALTVAEITAAIDRLKAAGLARIVHPGSGARTTRYRQVLDERLSLDDGERAVITLLLLRGPQTPGELRSRAERLHRFDGLDDVAAALARLRARDEPLVHELERQPGQKERRWTHLLADGGPADAPPASPTDSPAGAVRADDGEARDRRVVATYDAVAATYAARFLTELDDKPFDRWLLERLATEAGSGAIADVGCGPGHVAAFLAMAAVGPVSGFDLSPGMVAEARARFPEVRFEVADLRAVPAPHGGAGAWSLLTAWYALVHLAGSELDGALAALADRLAPAGCLALALHVGGETRHVDEWCDHAVDIDLVLHDRAEVLAAVARTGLVGIEWYLRGPYGGAAGEQTERLYVVGRRP